MNYALQAAGNQPLQISHLGGYDIRPSRASSDYSNLCNLRNLWITSKLEIEGKEINSEKSN